MSGSPVNAWPFLRCPRAPCSIPCKSIFGNSNDMKFLAIEKPRFTVEEVRRFAQEHYGLAGTLTALESERDQSFRMTEAGGRQAVVKIANRHEADDIVPCQVAALEHIRLADPALPVPRVLHTRSGAAVAWLDSDAGHRHAVHALSWLEGEVVAERILGDRQLQELGETTARLGRALRGFFHKAAGDRELLWDNRHAPQLLQFVPLLADQRQQELARCILEQFRERTLPTLAKLRAQVIHGDVHPYNVLLGPAGAVTGIIDFGDLIHGALIQDLSNVVADFMGPAQDFEKTATAIIGGYRGVTELEEAEIDVLPGMIEARLLQTVLVNRVREENHTMPESYLAGFGVRCFPLLEALRSGSKAFVAAIRRAAALSSRPAAGSSSLADLMAQRIRHMGRSLYHFYDPPLHLVRGEGVWLHDAGNNRFLDCYNNVPHVGHCHPYVTEAIVRQARRLNTNTRYITDQSLDYAARLAATADPALSAVVYVNSGSEANDVAWRMAKTWTGNRGALVMEFAYHGVSEATDALSPSNAPGSPIQPHVRTIPPPDVYRGPYRRGEPDLGIRYADLADVAIAELQESGLGVAALIIDSAFMTNGMLEPVPRYLATLCAKVRAAGGLFIADEVQSGFGRLGNAMWGYQHHGVSPDFITIGKPAGNGHPIGAVLTRPEILDRFTREAQFFSTFGGNNVSCAAGLAVLDVIRDEDLIANAAHTGSLLKTGLQRLMAKHDIIGDVRGSGLAIGVELVTSRRSLEPAKAHTLQALNLIRDEGVLVGSEGKLSNILKIRPPMVFEPRHAELAVAAVDRALSRL